MIEKNLSRLINSFFESKVDRKRTHAKIICQIRAYAMNLKEEKGTSKYRLSRSRFQRDNWIGPTVRISDPIGFVQSVHLRT